MSSFTLLAFSSYSSVILVEPGQVKSNFVMHDTRLSSSHLYAMCGVRSFTQHVLLNCCECMRRTVSSASSNLLPKRCGTRSIRQKSACWKCARPTFEKHSQSEFAFDKWVLGASWALLDFRRIKVLERLLLSYCYLTFWSAGQKTWQWRWLSQHI